jgi:CheY-like chemotaxis protein
MPLRIDPFSTEFDSNFQVYHELMARKVREILLVSTPYDAWIMQEDGRLPERIINEYRGLNLSHPPRFTWVATAEEALLILDRQSYDMVIVVPSLPGMTVFALSKEIKRRKPDLPVLLFSHSHIVDTEEFADHIRKSAIDRAFVWTGNTDILMAAVKSAEDRMNAQRDTALAGIRIILLVENSALYISTILPVLYKELVNQTRAVLEGQLNEEHRLLTMRARPKILVAETYEEAQSLFEQFEPYILGVISDVRFPRQGVLDDDAGIDFLRMIKQRRFDIPLLLTSMNPANAERAAGIGATFIHKESPTLQEEIRFFFKYNLAFDDFMFRMPDGQVVGRASDLRELEHCLHTVPDESLLYHSSRNDFSRWLFTRTETTLAAEIRNIIYSDYPDTAAHREHLTAIVHARRRARQKGVIADFDANDIDLVTEFFKIGQGSLGGKARGLAFLASLLRRHSDLRRKHGGIDIFVPQSLVLTTEVFEVFIEQNHLKYLSEIDLQDHEVARRLLPGKFSKRIESDLRAYLERVRYPLAIRSSGLLEDAQFEAYAGLYRTYMLPNNHPDLERRLMQLMYAIKLVYASTFFQAPKAFSRRVGRRTEEERMAVIIQELVGARYNGFFYPTISGVAQSHNYYPFARMSPEDGIATVVMGLGKAVVDGEKALRFSPRHPQILPQRSTVEDILENSQRFFYALRLDDGQIELDASERGNLDKREVTDVWQEPPMQFLASTFLPQEGRIRDTAHIPGPKVLTFANVLKYNEFPLSEILVDMLALGERGMGTPVEIEFSVNFHQTTNGKPEFALLQIRPMTARAELERVNITRQETQAAFCYSSHALGNAKLQDISDIIFVRRDAFDPGKTREIAAQIGRFNAALLQEGRKYLLIGPGRWGTSDRWLGIPVGWADISGVGVIVEAASEKLRAEPSQGSHFFHNITTLGINYITVSDSGDDRLDWEWLEAQPTVAENHYVVRVHLSQPLTLKVDGRTSRCVMLVG